jgi:hypothetical protein
MLTDPKDYINHYVDILKKEYKFNNLKVNYHGFVGFLMNLFAWTNYDLKQYYDYLFKEGFLSTSEDVKNLYQHASRYGYTVGFAIPTTVRGNFIFNLSNIPPMISETYKREITFPTPLKIKIGNYEFQTDSQYVFIEENSAYYCQINSANSRQRLISSASPLFKVPIYNLKQYIITSYDKVIPNYDYGSYYQYSFNIDDKDYLNDLVVNIKKSGSSDYEQYNISRIKSFDTSISKNVYLDQKSDRLYIIELGNGYHGVWLPNSIINIDIYTTKGKIVNSLATQKGIAIGTFSIIDYDSNGTIVDQEDINFSATNLVVDCQTVDGGTDTLTSSDLKNDIVRWVETRDNLINKTDFFNTFERYLKDFDVIFKKSHFIDNNFYLCRILRDQYKNVLYTTNYTYKCLKFDDPNLIKNLTTTILPNYTNSELQIGRHYYKIVAVDKFYKAIPSQQITTTILDPGDDSDTAISLTWDVVPEAEYYKIFGRTNQYNQYWIVDKDHIDIDGQVYFIDMGQIGTPENCGNVYSPLINVNFPEFEIDLSEIINLTEDFYEWNLYSNDENGITYKIVNKTFWFPPVSITREKDGVETDIYIFNTSRLDQLVGNSCVIIDRILYIKLKKPFTAGVDLIKAKYDKDVTLMSPFVYKYNSFFDWFEGYFLYDNIVQYFMITQVTPGITIPVSHINVVYYPEVDKTYIFINSHQSLNNNYIFKMKIDDLDNTYVDIYYVDLLEDYLPSENHYFRMIDGFIDISIKINIECYQFSNLQFRGSTAEFQQTYKIDDQLVLPKYISEDDEYYICNIPVLNFLPPVVTDIDYNDYDYIYSQIFEFVQQSNIHGNRIQSDSVQTRFLNSAFCDSYFSDKILIQDYNHNIILPLNISVEIKYKNQNIDSSDDIELLIADYLQNYATGVNIKFYKSQIIDLIHDYNPDILSVKVDVFDSYGSPLDNGVEVKPQDSLLPSIDTKLKMLEYVSVYWWWNLNNIIIIQTN